jgi:predicted DNA-binding protein (UPF0251 family)
MMARPVKRRRIGCDPQANYFKPRGIPVADLEEVVLTMDELEAIRLADLEECYQETASRQMDVSRQTFGNIVKSAHKKIAAALVQGKALKIEGGIYTMTEKMFQCDDCRHEWSVPYGTGRPNACPQCGSTNLHRSEKDRGPARRDGAGRGGGKGRCGRQMI